MQKFKFRNLNILYTEKIDNSQQIIKSLPVKKVIFPNQTHSCNIKGMNDNLSNCDGIYTTDKNIAIGVKTADCGAIVLSDFKKVLVVHAGWRGLVRGILDNALNQFENEIEIAFLSPFARSCCYEVKQDFIENLKDDSKKYVNKKKDKFFFSMEDIIYDKLKEKVKTIIDSKRCTICDKDLYSYRKGDKIERMFTISWLE